MAGSGRFFKRNCSRSGIFPETACPVCCIRTGDPIGRSSYPRITAGRARNISWYIIKGARSAWRGRATPTTAVSVVGAVAAYIIICGGFYFNDKSEKKEEEEN
jgi:hypothetical protein